MGDIVLCVVGGALIVLVLVDLFTTTISLSSVRGPVSTRLSASFWNIVRRVGGMVPVLHRTAGVILVLLVLLGWLAGLTLGWALIFSVDGALESSAGPGQQTSSARFVDAVFFVFGTLIGRGSSSFSPEQAGWSSVEAVMSLTGVALITLALAWILPIVSAVVHKRAVAARLSALGGTPQEIIGRGWNGRDLGDLHLHMIPLIGELTVLAQRHLAYPVIHYFNSTDQRTAIGPRIAALDEALTLIDVSGLDDPGAGTGLGPSATRPLRQAVTDYLDTLEHIFIREADEAPEPPHIGALVEGGLVDGATFPDQLRRRCDDLEDRRRLLLGYVRHDGQSWDDVTTSRDEAQTESPDSDE